MNVVNGQVVPLAVVCGLALAAVAFSLMLLWRAQSLVRAGARSPAALSPPYEAALEVLQRSVEALESQFHEIRQQPPVTAVVPAAPRAGLNLDKRSQALRMHRRGEPPARIAAALEVPLQEVHLLLKVHRIVLRGI